MNGDPRKRPATVIALITMVLVAVVALAACGSDAEKSAGGDTRTVKTDNGVLTVPAHPQRIVSLSAAVTGYLFSLGTKVTATDPRAQGAVMVDGFPSQWSAEARRQGTTIIPGGDKIDLEAVAKAKPDLIVGGLQGFTSKLASDAYDKLKEIAPTVLVSPTVTNWQDQLRQVADAVNASDKVGPLLTAYDAKLAEVKKAIHVPGDPVTYALITPSNQPTFIPQTAALPQLLQNVGLVPDDVTAKAKNPKLYGTGDSFILSPELVGETASAPVLFFIRLGGKSFAQLKTDPMYKDLPAFTSGKVFELPNVSFRFDYQGAMTTLGAVQKLFG